ncbi:VacB/RNase II family 3'-5' exoribonuclease [bacterium]|nr:VacB/RNase II family 3'-5' exoribonuclease [bacterium]
MSSKNNQKIPAPVRVQEILRSNPKGLTAGALARILKISRTQMQSILNQLERKNTITSVGNRFYDVTQQGNRHQGRFKRKFFGSGQVEIEGMPDTIQINRKHGYNLVDGDLVNLIVLPGKDGKPKGNIISIQERRKEPITGYFRKSSSGASIYPLDPRLSRPINIDHSTTRNLKDKVVLVKINHNRNHRKSPRGKIIKVLGKRFDFGVQTSIITHKFGIRDEMPKSVETEAENLILLAQNNISASRKDLREMLTITVDPVNARDFDDALSLEILPDGYNLYIHIADVSHYIPEGSAVDREAYLRGTSVYLPERAIHMLPETLATNVCSLRPNEDRLAVTVKIELCSQGKIRGGNIFESQIRSDARLTYGEFLEATQSVSNENISCAFSSDIIQLCEHLAGLCNSLLIQRVNRGVLDLDMPEPFFELDENGKVAGIHKKKRSIAEQTIEEFMIAANVVVAEFLHNKNTPYLRRSHEPPDPAEITELRTAINQLGLQSPENPLDPVKVRELLARIENPAIRSVVSHRILRAMRRAVYSVTNSGHFGLALDYYTQFTSPIRRYPDLSVHRSIKAALKLPGYSQPTALGEKARVLSDRERRSQEAEWDAQKIEKIRFMQTKIGNEYMATVTNVIEFGAYVELDEPFVNGFIPVSMLDDYFHYEETGNSLCNSDRSVILKPGTSVSVKLEMADLDRGMLDFSLA